MNIISSVTNRKILYLINEFIIKKNGLKLKNNIKIK